MSSRTNAMAITLATTIVSGVLLHVHKSNPLTAIHLAAAAAFTTMVVVHARSHNGGGLRRGFGQPQQTAHIALDPHRCQACWECVSACPKQVLGKVDFPIHKHAKVVNPDACIGCKKCVKACQHGAITAIAKDK